MEDGAGLRGDKGCTTRGVFEERVEVSSGRPSEGGEKCSVPALQMWCNDRGGDRLVWAEEPAGICGG